MTLLKSKYGVSVFFACALVVICGLYFPVIHAPFLFDDSSSIVNNPAIRSLDLKQIYDFKPLRFTAYLSFALNFHFSQLNPLSYHLVNVGIHFFYVIFCFLFFHTLCQTPSGNASVFSSAEKKAIALAVALVIALHPLSAFAVSYIVQRLASLTALFYIGCLFFYLRARLSRQIRVKTLWAAGCIVFLVCGLFTKENFFSIFPQIFFLELLCFELTARRRVFFMVFGPLAAAGVLIFIHNDIIDLNEIRRMTLETTDMTRLEYFFTQFSVVCFYIKSFFIPLDLALDYDRKIFSSLADPGVFIPGLILAGIFVIIIWWATRRKFRIIAYGMVFYFTAIAIESSFIPIRDTIFLHRTYLPNSGLAFASLMAVYTGVKKWRIKPAAAISCLCLWTAVLGGFTFQTNMVFASPVSVWERVLAMSPGYLKAYMALGNHYVSNAMEDKYPAAREYIFAVYEHFPDNTKNLNNMGILLNREHKFDEAVACFKRIIQLNNKYGNAYANLGSTYANMAQYDLAVDILEKGYQAAPDNYALLVNYGQMLAILAPGPESQYRKALRVLEEADAINADNPLIFYSKGLAWFNLKNYTLAEQNFRQVLEIDPSFDSAKDFLTRLAKIHADI